MEIPGAPGGYLWAVTKVNRSLRNHLPWQTVRRLAAALLLRRDRATAGRDWRHADAHDGIIVGTEVAISGIPRHGWSTDNVVGGGRSAADIAHSVDVPAPGAGLQILIDQAS